MTSILTCCRPPIVSSSRCSPVPQLCPDGPEVPLEVVFQRGAVPPPRPELELALVDGLRRPQPHRVHERGVALAEADLEVLGLKYESLERCFFVGNSELSVSQKLVRDDEGKVKQESATLSWVGKEERVILTP